MSNFEKWKQELNIENTAKAFEESLTCEFCPAYYICQLRQVNNCMDAFKKWAEQLIE